MPVLPALTVWDSPAASRICKQLASEGIGMLRFDNLGLGDSEGDWGDGSAVPTYPGVWAAGHFGRMRMA
jgi:hypothetical protein